MFTYSGFLPFKLFYCYTTAYIYWWSKTNGRVTVSLTRLRNTILFTYSTFSHKKDRRPYPIHSTVQCVVLLSWDHSEKVKHWANDNNSEKNSYQWHKDNILAGDCLAITAIAGKRHLRSAGTRILSVPRTRTTLGMRSFMVAGPFIWNSLPAALRSATLSPLMKFVRHLKDHLFNWSKVHLRTIYDVLYKSTHHHHHSVMPSVLKHGRSLAKPSSQ